MEVKPTRRGYWRRLRYFPRAWNLLYRFYRDQAHLGRWESAQLAWLITRFILKRDA